MLPTAWCGGLVRAPYVFDVRRWLPTPPAWIRDQGVWVEPPPVLSYVTAALLNPDSVVWKEVYDEYYGCLLAGWVNGLRADSVFTWLPPYVVRDFDKLDVERIVDMPDGVEILEVYRDMRRAHDEIPWGRVMKDVIRRHPDTQEALQVIIQKDSSCAHGFGLRFPCAGFDWVPDSAAGRNAMGGRAPGRVPDRRSPPPSRRGPAAVPPRAGRRVAARSPSAERDRSLSPSADEEPAWVSPAVRNAGVALFGSRLVRSIGDEVVTRCASAAALANAWFVQVGDLKAGLSRADGKSNRGAAETLATTVSDACSRTANFEAFRKALADAKRDRTIAVTPSRFHVQALLGRRPHERDDEEQDGRNTLRRNAVDEGEGDGSATRGWSATPSRRGTWRSRTPEREGGDDEEEE